MAVTVQRPILAIAELLCEALIGVDIPASHYRWSAEACRGDIFD